MMSPLTVYYKYNVPIRVLDVKAGSEEGYVLLDVSGQDAGRALHGDALHDGEDKQFCNLKAHLHWRKIARDPQWIK
jgi:hypothetical protein